MIESNAHIRRLAASAEGPSPLAVIIRNRLALQRPDAPNAVDPVAASVPDPVPMMLRH